MKKRQSEFRSVTKIILISIKLGCSSERENRINGYFAKFILIMIIKISHHEASWLSLCTDLEKKLKLQERIPHPHDKSPVPTLFRHESYTSKSAAIARGIKWWNCLNEGNHRRPINLGCRCLKSLISPQGPLKGAEKKYPGFVKIVASNLKTKSSS